MDVKVSSKKEREAEAKAAPETKRHAKEVQEEHKAKTDELREQLTEALSNILLGEKIPLDVVNSETGEIIIPANRKITKTLLRKLAQVYDRIEIDPSPIRNKINEIIGSFKKKFDELQMQHDEEIERVEAGEEVDSGVIKSVKVYIASKRKLSVGDKMAGRHGNKGVVAKIVPEEDMPFLPDGTPVDIVLNPLGVPSRMNVGQVLETHLGWAARLLGLKFATPVFDGIKEKDIRDYLKEAKLPEHGKTLLYRRPHRRAVRPGDRGRLHLHDEAGPLGGGQDPRPRRRPLLPGHPAAAGRQGPVRRPALRRNGSLGHGSLRRRLQPAGAAHRQVRRRPGPHPDLREHRQGRQLPGGRHARILQRPGQGNAVPGHGRQSRLLQPGGTSRRRASHRLEQPQVTRYIFQLTTMNTKETARELLGLDKVNQVEYVAISVASPETIRAWSKGEVKNPETINYRTFKPEKGGLFCERIFGPVKDWECSCGKYKRIKHRGVVCDRCGVEVTLARVRRERMGHIELAVPVSHIWFFKCMPSRLGLVLDMTARNLERVIYYEDYMVIDPGSTPLKLHQLLSEHEYREARETYGADAFVAKMGAEAVREALANVDLQKQVDHLSVAMSETKSKQIRKKIAKRIKLLSRLSNPPRPAPNG